MWKKTSIKIGNADTFSKKTMLMGKIGMDAGEVSTPLQPCSEGLRAKLDDMIAKLGITK